LKSIPPWSS